ncbi:MAG: phytanoyl-CoA dioxygenase family protein [SAR324 cluster bacterium]|nr:phytanoyl-CoA dioxygenase family protein [SAR324 cluster bacterium]|tara:strand:+ start:216 stop:1016 length:801 start_codon:yes stop_codon:yes gene_type:complete
MPTLTDQQIYQYRTNGFVNGGPLISESSADELAQSIDKVIHRNDLSNSPKPDILRNLSSTEEQPIWQIVNIWKASSLFAKLLEISELKEMAETLTGKHHFRLWHDQVQYKPKEIGGRLHWHQDLPLWPVMHLGGTQITAWIALDHVGTHNGCMFMVPGSHRYEDQNSWLQTHEGKWELESHFNFNGIPPQVMCPVQKGHVHFHHSLTWHSSGLNRSGLPRRAIAIHLMAPDTLYNSSGNHLMKQFITSQDGEPINGDGFLPIAAEL